MISVSSSGKLNCLRLEEQKKFIFASQLVCSSPWNHPFKFSTHLIRTPCIYRSTMQQLRTNLFCPIRVDFSLLAFSRLT